MSVDKPGIFDQSVQNSTPRVPTVGVGSDISVVVNGGPVEVPDGTTVAEVVRRTTVAERGLAVAVNGEVVPRAEWGRALAAGDSVEVLVASQGG